MGLGLKTGNGFIERFGDLPMKTFRPLLPIAKISSRPLRPAAIFKRNYLFGMAITRKAIFDLRQAQA